MRFGFSLYSLALCLLISALIASALIDYDHGYIPDGAHICIFLAAFIAMLSAQSIPLAQRFFGSAIIPAIMALVSLLTHGGIGMGDIKLFVAVGFFLGLKLSIPAFFLGYILAFLFLIPKMLRKQLHKTQEIHMAPYFALSIFIISVFGNQLVDFYISLL
ncbi:MAG: A24 family peptidase [Oscillospiraceae bacterium]